MKKNYLDQQKKYFKEFDSAQFSWRVYHPYIAKLEKRLLDKISLDDSKKILEVGCGEGNNIFLLSQEKAAGEFYGIDFQPERIKFAQKFCPRVKFSVDDATKLPFADNFFDLVFCRDVLHHIDNKKKVIFQMLRVLKPNGRMFIIEHNEDNPVIFLWRTFNPYERSNPPSTYKTYTKILEKEDNISKIKFLPAEPFSISRILFHYKYGLAKLGYFKIFQNIVSFLETLIGKFLPKKRWGYLVFEVIKS